jgi:hypothetical protein
MDRNPAPYFRLRVLPCSGNELQSSSNDRFAADFQSTPNGFDFELNWIMPGCKHRALVQASIDRQTVKQAAKLVVEAAIGSALAYRSQAGRLRGLEPS